MNGLTLVALIAIAIGTFIAYRVGVMHGRRGVPRVSSASAIAAPAERVEASDPAQVQRLEGEVARLERALVSHEETIGQLSSLADERLRLIADLEQARGETSRYRQIVIDIEDNTPPPLLASPNAPDDLKLIVGVGPVLERMLQQMGIGTYRQIARWSERDIDDFDAKLAEFPGRIRRDDWVTQARELHQSKYGERP